VEVNSNAGTDHGAASVMLALGAGVNGGELFVTTDYRQVLAELLIKRMGQTTHDKVFPTIKYAPLGIARSI